MSVRAPLADLEVVGYVGRARREDAPRRLMAVFRGRGGERVLVPPVREEGDVLEGEEVREHDLAAFVDEGEATLLAEPLLAHPAHTLWMSPDGPRYEEFREAERRLDACAVDALARGLARGLEDETARDALFGALRVRPTVLANALLAVHFQLTGDTRLARPVREDLAGLTGRDTGPLERRVLEAAWPLLSSSAEVATAVATETRRAGRTDLAEEILKTVPAGARSASEPAPPLSWAGTFAWGRAA
jgi:hypothetical protein